MRIKEQERPVQCHSCGLQAGIFSLLQLDSGLKIAGMTVYVRFFPLISYIELRLIRLKNEGRITHDFSNLFRFLQGTGMPVPYRIVYLTRHYFLKSKKQTSG